jgi:hypothetical protein
LWQNGRKLSKDNPIKVEWFAAEPPPEVVPQIQVCRSLFTPLLLNDFPLEIGYFSDKREPVQTFAASGFVSPYP